MDETVWKYTGTGEFIDGIPARDLTRYDMARMSEDQTAAVEQSRLYRRAPRQVVAPPAKEPAVEKEEEVRPNVEEAAKGDKES